MTDDILNALAGGAVVITANARAARALILRHGEHQRAARLSMWSTPAIFDWDTWLARLWQEYSFLDTSAPLLLTSLQEQTLWMHVQQSDANLVVSPEALASLAQSAYARLSEYQQHERRSNAWFESDAEHFRQWTKQFDQLCSNHNWVSRSKIESLVSQAYRADTLPKHVLLVGFDHFTPAQQSLLQHLRDAGIVVDVALPAPVKTANKLLLVANEAREELLTCAEWCRQRLESDPNIRIGVVAPDVSNIRAEADRVFRNVLMPQSLDLANDTAAMPFEFSLGTPLATIPLIRAALLLLRWISEPLLEEDISWLLLSGFFHGNRGEILDLAKQDFKQRDSGALSPEVSLRAFVKRNASTHFSKCLAKLLKATDEGRMQTSTHAYGSWSELVTRFLQLAEWPGFRAPDSVQFQAQQRWLRLLDEISLLDFAGRTITYSEFLRTLDRHANETTFSAESHHAPIQILGAFESSGQTFDAIWFLGVDDTRWPQTGRPHPLLPLTLQRQARMPHCDAATDTEIALIVTRRIADNARECIFSYARQNKEGELRPSPILAAIFDDNIDAVSAAEFRARIGVPESKPLHLESESAIVASQIAAWPVERVAGGADVLRDQSACPFRAFGMRRLAAQPLNRTEWGLDAAQRGSLLHSILEAIWSPETPEPFRMISLDDLKSVVAAQRLDEALRYHIGNAFRRLVHEHSEDSWMQAYLESEQQRLLVRLHDWMMYEAMRQPFIVAKREERLRDVSVGELKLNLRADRIDELPDSSHVLIDYKTGEVSPSAWKGERLDEPQLPLYAVHGNVERVSGLVFAQIRAGKPVFVGRAANAHQNLMADLTASSSLVSQPYDNNMHDAWQQALHQLAEEFLHGEASVDPKRRADTCMYCELPGLCRVAEAGLANEPDESETENA
ncbi:PD-(D/E)XK nuclease family protein [Alloacidobacterium dinghuense]|uniref:PD-(D/E)XK nuclease family protein n=1 Tax=Alloacidobacterium dinghuense TaxID=2763107 RepID=A0A7G8BM18_9BACT|nr:PD-(D/E)XK nuclease family protein [Alloacidobacterium dinghuense]QNI33588.1 PD-(D/E)XK nuclease family protein [Alloacidobacterium dinghuense]